MKYAIIAAGEGSRLAQEGIAVPKPLVRLCGEPMIDRLIRIFNANGAEEICIIVNDLHPETAAHVRRLMALGTGAPIRLTVRTTPSSMHSFFALREQLAGAPFCLTTVDTIFREDDFSRYIAAFRAAPDLDGMMAVTDYVDDEKPLWVGTDDDLNISGFYDNNASDTNDGGQGRCRYISGGIYALRPTALDTLDRCMATGQSRMRNFQRALVADGRKLRAFPLTKILDVDHAGDIAKAEAFISHNAARSGNNHPA